MDYNLFAPLIDSLGQGGTPLRVEVILTPSEEVMQLRQQIHDLQAQLDRLQQQYDRTEYLYRCEVLISLQLSDLCRAQGVNVPRALYERPDRKMYESEMRE